MKVKFQELELNIRFDNEEVFKVMRAFFVENQLLSRLLHQLLESNEIEIDVDEERQAMKASYQSNYNTRKDAFFAKYERLLMEKLVNDAQKSGVEDGVEAAASEDSDEDSSEDSSEDSEAIRAGSKPVN
jgi:glucose-6-phosphate 1-dehydrogenase